MTGIKAVFFRVLIMMLTSFFIWAVCWLPFHFDFDKVSATTFSVAFLYMMISLFVEVDKL